MAQDTVGAVAYLLLKTKSTS